MEIRINKRTNNAKIELTQHEELMLLNIVSLAKEFQETKAIKTACDCTDEIFNLFAKDLTK